MIRGWKEGAELRHWRVGGVERAHGQVSEATFGMLLRRSWSSPAAIVLAEQPLRLETLLDFDGLKKNQIMNRYF